MTEPTPVRGPLYVAATPLMVTVDVTPLVEANVAELLDLLASDEFYDDFREYADAEPTGRHDGHAPERLPAENLTARLVAHLATRVALTGPQAVRVAGRMHELGRPLAEAAQARDAVVRRARAAAVAAAPERRTA
ncbi:hypothetical protein [Streptomyces fumanus]|uniref:hypothetical protein n=1 Tax=Streptomyces fumanus TaxID=67302 RepID=UPI0033FE448A